MFWQPASRPAYFDLWPACVMKLPVLHMSKKLQNQFYSLGTKLLVNLLPHGWAHELACALALAKGNLWPAMHESDSGITFDWNQNRNQTFGKLLESESESHCKHFGLIKVNRWLINVDHTLECWSGLFNADLMMHITKEHWSTDQDWTALIKIEQHWSTLQFMINIDQPSINFD